jgi:hypothetical protein
MAVPEYYGIQEFVRCWWRQGTEWRARAHVLTGSAETPTFSRVTRSSLNEPILSRTSAGCWRVMHAATWSLVGHI